MTSGGFSAVIGNDGPIHSGSGNQINYFDAIRIARRGRDLRAVARDHLSWLNPRFVEPTGYGEAAAKLQDPGCVLLTGQPGIGRHATAQMLLHRLSGEGRIRELPDTPGGPDEPLLDIGSVVPGDRLLLNLSASEEDHFRAVLRELPSFRAEVRERTAHLAVVLPDQPEQQLEIELLSMVVTIKRPSGFDVLRRCLGEDRITFADDQLRVTDLRPHLDSMPMQELAALARLIGRARAELGRPGTFPAWLAEALAALTNRSKEVAAQIKDQRAGRPRALLLTSAMLNGAPGDQVHHATNALLSATGQPTDERPELEREDLTEQFAMLKMATDKDGRVGFQKLDYDRAVRDYYWTNFPGLLDRFRVWVNQVVTADRLTAEDQNEFVFRFAEQALRTDRPTDLITLINKWTTPAESTGRCRSLPAAATALLHGLNNQRYGGRFRRQIYDWSKQHNLPADVAYLAIQMCVDVIDSTNPSEAVVRLHHLVRHQRGNVRATATDALLGLVARDHRQFRYLLSRLATSLAGRPWHADFDLFLDLARPEILLSDGHRLRLVLADSEIGDMLVTGWRAVLFDRPVEFWLQGVQDWLSAARDGAVRGRLLDVLVAAGANRSTTLSRLYLVARDWGRAAADDRTTRIAVFTELNHKIDRAQGIPSADAEASQRNEETTR
ncbi:MAG TPA: hypothetical protein VHW44_28765 [Pseudonocardiaceae bacterium]|nr:hypothetical protein [Pseudonocardiaceae bacterium]